MIFLLFIIVASTVIKLSLPKPLFTNPLSFITYSSNGNLLGAKIAEDGQWRFPASDKISKKFAIAITAYEDKRFLFHNGIDPFAIARAIYLNIKFKKIISGGSTITMQVARLSQKNPPRTFIQKSYEIYLAWLIEKNYSKREILSLYASNAPFGGNVVGLQAASWRYFGRTPDQLSWAESCMLAVLPNSPSLVHPGKNRTILKRKRDQLLDKLYKMKVINMEMCCLSKDEPIPEKPNEFPQEAPHLLARLMQQSLSAETHIQKTTISEKLQHETSLVLNRYKRILEGNGINNSAAIIIEVESGNVLAYIGNYYSPKDEKNGCQVDILDAPRSTGSILKPILYAAMLNSGDILPNSLVPDIPVQIGSYAPKNFNKGYDGAVPANRALAKSLNVPAVKMLQSYGIQKFIYLLQKLGLTTINRSADDYGLSLILGGCEGKLYELTGIYASMARTLNHYLKTGKYAKCDFHPPVLLQQDNQVSKSFDENNSWLNASSIWFAFQAMLDVDRPIEESNWQMFSSGRKIAWKTGTSFGFRDGWAIGVTPKYAVGVWIGNADGEGRPELTGIKTAAPVLFDIFGLLPKDDPWFETPFNDMIKTEVCHRSGFLASDICTETKDALIPKSGINFKKCPYDKLIHLDNSGKFQVNSDCEDPSRMIHKPWFVLPPAMEFYFKYKNNFYEELPPFREDCKEKLLSNPNAQMEIIYPKNYTQIYIPKELDGKPGSTVFEVAHRKPGITIYWSIDNKFICQTKGFHHTAINPAPGKHTLTLTDDDGESLSIIFEVLDKEEKNN